MLQRALNRDYAEVQNDSELEFHASGFIVRVEGKWTLAKLARFRHFLKLRGLLPSTEQLAEVLERAKQKYFAQERELHVCDERPCRGLHRFAVSDEALRDVGRRIGLPISKSGCQGVCKRAPVASLRIGQRSQVLAEVATERDWSAVLSFAEAAARAESLLVPAGDAERLFYDPAHPREELGAHLRPLGFLLGRFRGEGRYSMSSDTFQKEVVGSYEAGGRFIALRMDASYPTAGGGNDVHKALVIVGAEPSSGAITGRAYTDGGLVHEYTVERHERALNFPDAPPDHSADWTRARKILEPTADGFEERLEVDDGSGFKTYYAIPMRRIAAP
ncbi:MAG: hypothetical protein ABW061_08685 [Polyangiaceae bacterium]